MPRTYHIFLSFLHQFCLLAGLSWDALEGKWEICQQLDFLVEHGEIEITCFAKWQQRFHFKTTEYNLLIS